VETFTNNLMLMQFSEWISLSKRIEFRIHQRNFTVLTVKTNDV